MAYTSCAVANAFLDLAQKGGCTLTNMQVQKLVYFAHGYILATLGRPLFRDTIKAWTFGPVIPPLYNRLKKYGNSTVTKKLTVTEPDVDLGTDEGDIIQAVWDAFKDYMGSQLSSLSHIKGSPWDRVWSCDEYGVIPDDMTEAYYQSHLKAG